MTSSHSFPQVESSLLAGLLRIAAQDISSAESEVDRETARLALARLRELAFGQKRERYVLQEEIARGGMGIVYRVHDNDVQRTLAMKVVLGRHGAEHRADDSCDPVMLARFLEEARVTGQLDHPGIVPLHELGIDARGCIFFTMRLVRGWHLGEVFDLASRSEEGWNRERVIEALVKACDAMSYAHSKGVVHRDLKPQNVMTGRFGEVYVMDWGVAKVLARKEGLNEPNSRGSVSLLRTGTSDSSGRVTIAGSVFGTPTYMAPEQARGAIEDVDARSDVYSLGAILYHLLAGHAPYTPPGTKVSASTVLKWVIEGPPQALSVVASTAPRELVAVCEKAMARVPAQRYTGARELGDDLRAWLAGRPVSALPLTAVARAARWCRRYPWIAALLAAVTLGGSLGLWRVTSLGADLAVRAAVDDAAAKARMLETVNALYASSVAGRVDKAHVEVTHDWQDKSGAIPLPATFLTELASRISADSGGTLVKHYSDMPFLFRAQPQLDAFGTRALAELRANPDLPIKQVEEIDGRSVLRYAVARRMGASCVKCHNDHPDSPKHDWKEGDVRGVLEIDRPLDAEVERSRGVRTTLMAVGGLVLGLTALCAFALVRAARGEHAQ